MSSYGSNSNREAKKTKYRTVYHMTVVFCGTVLAMFGSFNGIQSPWISFSGIGIIFASISLYTANLLLKRIMKKDRIQ